MKQERVALAAIVILAAVPFVVPLIRGEVFTFRDHTDYFQPLRYHTARVLRSGQLPLWNPYSASGEPWLANPQTGVFYPPAWLFVVMPFRTAYMLFLLFHLALLGAGVFLLFRRLAGVDAAFIGAIAVMFSGPVLSMLDVQNNLATAAWLPFVANEALAMRRGCGSTLRAAFFLSLSFLGGEPFLAAAGALLFCAIVRSLRPIVATASSSAGICAVQLLPMLEAIARSDRQGGFRAEEILRDSMPVRDWLRIAAFPNIGESGFDPSLSQHYVPVVYAGVTVCLLAVAGVISLMRARRWRTVAGWSLALIVIAALASGPSLVSRLPLTLFRYPARLIPLGTFIVVAFAVWGWDAFRRARWITALLAVVIAVELMAASWPLLAAGEFRTSSSLPPSFGRSSKILRLIDDPHRLSENRIGWLSGYLNLYERRFDAWTAAPFTSRGYADVYDRAVRQPAEARALAVGYALASRRLPAEDFVPLANSRGVIAYAVRGALPVAYVRMRDAIVPPAFIAFDSRHAFVKVDVPSHGLVILTQNDAPGWRVFVDGVEQRARHFHGVFRAVDIPPGHHEVMWTYTPRSLVFGAVMTITTFAALLSYSFVERRSRASMR